MNARLRLSVHAVPVIAALRLGCCGIGDAAHAQSMPNAPQTQPTPIVVTTSQGALKGALSADGVASFKGVPFAEPPVGSRRWTPATPAKPWSGVRDALAYGPGCMQRTKLSARETAAAGAPVETVSEDCLTLNVYAPARPKAPLPVMVWIHGGGHTSGAGSLAFYDGSSFARDGVILVSVNYRLGLLGYFAHPALTKAAAPDAWLGGYGTSDQIQALRWVKANIKAFGGDPDQVTVFGESAGAQSVLTLLATPAAKGLFKRAIVESAYIAGKFPTLEEAEASGAAAASAVGLPGAAAGLDQLRAVSAEALIAAQDKLTSGPIVDGRLLPKNPASAFARGEILHVPLVIGTNSDEGALVAARDPAAVLAETDPEVVAAGRSYFGAAAPTDAALARKLWRDWTFTAPSRWVAKKAAAGGSVWMYHFDYTPTRLRKVWDGVPHGYEVPLFFDSLAGLPQYAALLTPEDKGFIALAHGCWTAFAKTGRPACPGAPAWPAYDPAADAVLDFSVATTVMSHRDAPLLDIIETRLITSGKLPK